MTLPPGRGKLATKPLPTGSETAAKTMGMVRVCCSSAAVAGVVGERIKVGLQRDEFLGESLHRLRVVGCRPARVDPDVAALRPPELLESLPECRDIGLSLPGRSRHIPSARRSAASDRPAARVAASGHAAAAPQTDDHFPPPHSPTSAANRREATPITLSKSRTAKVRPVRLVAKVPVDELRSCDKG